MDRNDIKEVYSEDNKKLHFSEMPIFLAELVLNTEDENIKDKLLQCSIALELCNVIYLQ